VGDTEMLDYLKALRTKYLKFWPLTDLLEKMMADIAQIQADIAALQDASAAAANELEDLTGIIAELQAGQTLTPEQLDALHDSLQSVTTSLTAATQAADQAEPPHAAQT
jgi:uncharacterized coiled-coil protein SlyX